jgi:hypothetical protein
VLWLRRLVAGFSPRKTGFDPGSINVGFVVDKVALGQGILPSTSVFPCQFHSTGAPLHGKTNAELGALYGLLILHMLPASVHCMVVCAFKSTTPSWAVVGI